MTYSTGLLYKIEEKKKKEREIYRQELLERVKSKIKEIFATVNVDEVYITGSITDPGRFNLHSDIDIAVKGLSDFDYFSVLARLSEFFERNIELIEMENCRFTDKIEKKGIRIL